MNKIGPDEVYILIKRIEIIRDQAVEDRNAIISIYSSFAPSRDARITAFYKLINVYNSTQLALTFISKHLMHKDWWGSIGVEKILEADMLIYSWEFDTFAKIGFVQSLFSSVESSLRIFLRELDPSSCSNGLAEFKSIYECLFKSKLSSCPNGGVELLDLLRSIRNTIHHNGVYFHRSGTDATILWQGNNYIFRHGFPIEFTTWNLMIEVSDAIRRLMFTVIQDPILRVVTHEMKDLFAD